MTKEELLAKYNRIAEDHSQLKEFVNDMIDFVVNSDSFRHSIEVSNIKAMSDEECANLRCGDVVIKVDDSGKHAYIVSFRKDGTGMCLTYSDATCIETQSYDFTDGHWVYNSEDKWEKPEE